MGLKDVLFSSLDSSEVVNERIYMNRFYIIWVFTVFLSVCAYGSECKPSCDIDIRFRFDRSDLDTAYMDNARALRCIDAVLAECPFDEIGSIVVESTTSPESDYAYNRKLSARRAASMLGYLTRRYPSLTLKIYSSQKAESWVMLQECIAEDPRISAADKESLLCLFRSKEGVQLKKTRLSAHRLYPSLPERSDG